MFKVISTTISIYNRKVLFVTKNDHFAQRSQFKFFMVFHGSGWVFMFFHCSRLVFHGSGTALMVFHGSRLVFHGSRLVFHGFPWFWVGFHGVSWL